MENKTDEKIAKTRVSSSYTRVVGNVRIDVINTKQNPENLPKKALSQKWAVIATKGNRVSTIGTSAKKYPAIDILLSHEKILKAEIAKKDE
tara:strand:- start:155 stop:427 length:273 start_codon:yes stop_codon:yes gene_type:complete